MPATKLLSAMALSLALASILVTRLLKLFTLAEVLAVGACLAGAAILVLHRRGASQNSLEWPQRLIVTGSLIGLSGVAVKIIFVILGIGAAEHDMSMHDMNAPDSDLGGRVLEHIHHLFFNVGFLFMAAGAVGMLVKRLRSG